MKSERRTARVEHRPVIKAGVVGGTNADACLRASIDCAGFGVAAGRPSEGGTLASRALGLQLLRQVPDGGTATVSA